MLDPQVQHFGCHGEGIHIHCVMKCCHQRCGKEMHLCLNIKAMIPKDNPGITQELLSL